MWNPEHGSGKQWVRPRAPEKSLRACTWSILPRGEPPEWSREQDSPGLATASGWKGSLCNRPWPSLCLHTGVLLASCPCLTSAHACTPGRHFHRTCCSNPKPYLCLKTAKYTSRSMSVKAGEIRTFPWAARINLQDPCRDRCISGEHTVCLKMLFRNMLPIAAFLTKDGGTYAWGKVSKLPGRGRAGPRDSRTQTPRWPPPLHAKIQLPTFLSPHAFPPRGPAAEFSPVIKHSATFICS